MCVSSLRRAPDAVQAAARVWRDGQKKRVYIYRMVIGGSIEEKARASADSPGEFSRRILPANSLGEFRSGGWTRGRCSSAS